MKSIFNGVPAKKTVFLLFITTVFSLLHCLWSWFVSYLVGKTFDDQLIRLLVLMVALIVTWEITEYIGDVFSNVISETIENEVSQFYLNKLFILKPSVLKKSNTGYISGVVQKLISHQQTVYDQVVIDLPITVVYVIYFSVAIGKYHFMFGLFLVAVFIMSTVIRTLLNTFVVVERTEELADAEGNRNKLVIDLISNINTVQKMSALTYMNEKMREVKSIAMRACKRWAYVDEIAFISFKFTTLLYTPIIILWMYFTGNIEYMHNVEFQALLAAIAIQQLHNTRAVCVALRAYARFVGTKQKLDFVEVEDNIRWDLIDEPFKRLIAKDISYSYVEKKDGVDISHHIVIPDFYVKSGDFVCISGESGQGKTTLLDLISGQIETDNVWINGNNHGRLDCVFISQDTEVFDMSLRDNLTLGRNISDAVLRTMLGEVGLGEWLDSLEDGFDTLLGERGVFVSTGQRQRINLVRGLLINDKNVYLLDEPTSNVDTETEEKMINLIEKTLKGKTVVIVSHRMKIADICNRHYVFTNGVLSASE